MKKRILTVFLAVVLCIGLVIPAFAASSTEEATENFSLSIEIGGATFKYIEHGIFGERIVVNKEMHLTQWNGNALTGGGYNAVDSDTVFTARHAGTVDDGSYITIYSTAFVNNGNGVYEQDWMTSQVLTQDGFRDINVAQALGGVVYLKAGQSIQFELPTVTTLGKVEEDVFYFLEMHLNYPGSDITYSVGLLPFKLDDTAVDAYFADQAPTLSFTDVKEGAWYESAVAWAAESGIAQGTGNNKFSPTNNCTHVQILTFLWRAANKPASTATAFSNLTGDYAPAANWAYEQGMIDTSFDSNTPCTRADAVNYIWQALGSETPKETSNFTDVSTKADYVQAANWAVEQGIAEGTGDNQFSPDKICNRATIVTLLHRAYVKEARLTTK